jgi:inorganic pyrophosphatase
MNLVNDICCTKDNYNHVNCIIEIPKGTNTKYEYNKLHDIEQEHLKIYRQFFKIYKLDRQSETKVGDWKSSNIALKTAKESHERWEKANQARFHEEWADNQFWGKIKNGQYIVHPD